MFGYYWIMTNLNKKAVGLKAQPLKMSFLQQSKCEQKIANTHPNILTVPHTDIRDGWLQYSWA